MNAISLQFDHLVNSLVSVDMVRLDTASQKLWGAATFSSMLCPDQFLMLP